ncbi:secretogranin-1 [Perognathus longimembris pacificus]|uniref:secretogranin-1 n=1 Tax=Perognathus longimembris pacificus TaxID=214514 RepID=UPI0020191D6C|nr:secretogranin-1 [Perognathus longimembris pacificus]
MQPTALLSLLGAALLAAVNSVPVDNRSHNEEMVTRCIIEVLSNALSKSNIPSITPECRQVLKNSGKEVKEEENNENENTKFEVRLLRDPAATSEAHGPPSREEAGAPGQDTQGQTKADTGKWAEGGGHSQEVIDEPHGSPYPTARQVSKEANTRRAEKSEGQDKKEEEEGDYQKGLFHDDVSKGKQLEEPGEAQKTFLNRKNQATAKEKEGTRSDPYAEKTHSREESSQESGEVTSEEKHSQESNSRHQSEEESEESSQDSTSQVTKRRTRPRHHHGRTRPDRSSQEGHPPSEEGRHALEESEEANVGTANLEAKREHHSTHYRASEEEPSYEDLERGHYGGQGSEEYRALRPPSEESQEEEDKRNHPGSQRENMAYAYGKESEEEKGSEGTKGHYHRGRGGEPGAYSTPHTREDKRFLGEGRHHVQESQMDKARRYPQNEWQEQGIDYLNYGEEGAPGKWEPQEELLDQKGNREEARLQDKRYGSQRTTTKKKRLGVLFNPYFDPAQWKSSRFEKKDNMDDNFFVGEEDSALPLNERNFFPEYSYDWWEKKPFSEDVNWGYEKRSFPLASKQDLKRQYDRVAELDQLLHYRKKSDEFPDFYDAEEQMGTLQEAENEKDRADHRVLTEEEEKELENLAAMDLELQKIANKFSQRG